jgi:hypothetical protein
MGNSEAVCKRDYLETLTREEVRQERLRNTTGITLNFRVKWGIRLDKRLPDRQRELESVCRGIMFAFICAFALPMIVSGFILVAAVLNGGQGSLAHVLLPGSYWRTLLSFSFRISLIPGIAYLTHRGVSRLRDRRGEKRLLVVLASLMLLTVLVVMPPRPQPRFTLSEAASKPQQIRDDVYKGDVRTGRAAGKQPPASGLRSQRS